MARAGLGPQLFEVTDELVARMLIADRVDWWFGTRTGLARTRAVIGGQPDQLHFGETVLHQSLWLVANRDTDPAPIDALRKLIDIGASAAVGQLN